MNGFPLIPRGNFFDDFSHVAALHSAFARWDRTPFAEGSKAPGPGGGIDCVGFLEVTMFEAGAAPRFEFPRSASDYRGHRHNAKILNYLRGLADDPQSARLAQTFAELPNVDQLVPKPSWPDNRVIHTSLMCGDIVVVKSPTPGVWHLPIMRDDRAFMHCASPGGVAEGDITQEHFRSRIKAVFRARALPIENRNSKIEISP